MSKHSFDVEIACKVGANAAAVYEYIRYWCARNAKAGKNEHDGEYWMFCTAREFKEHFPYLSVDQINRSLKLLTDAELIKKGCFNKSPIDRTTWFTICGMRKIHLANTQNAFGEKPSPFGEYAKPIPIKEHNLRTKVKDNNPLTPFDEVLCSYPVIENNPDLKQVILDYMENRKALKSPIKTERALKLNINEAVKLADGDPNVMKAIFEQSIRNGWKGVFPLKTNIRQAQAEADTNPFRAIKRQEGRA